MNYPLAINRDKPSGLWMLDDTSPFQDYSGNSLAGDMSAGVPGTAAALVSLTGFSSVFSNTKTGRFASPVFQQGKETRSFSLESWIYPILKTTTGEQQVLSHLGQYDGLVVSGTSVIFTTKYLTATEARCQYELQSNRRSHVVGVHTAEKNMLYVNGILVDEVAISDAQQADQFVATDGFLYTGATTSSQELAVNAHGIYKTALSSEQIIHHFKSGSSTIHDGSVTNGHGGAPMEMNITSGNIFTEMVLEGDDFYAGNFIDSVLNFGKIQPVLFGGISQASSWTNTFSFASTSSTSIYGVSIDWTGIGVGIDVSLDGITWAPVEKRTLIPILSNGFDPTDKEIIIRASFAGGVVNDESYLERISIIGWLTADVPVYMNRQVTLGYPAVLRGDGEVFEYRDDTGLYLDGGSLTISADISPDPLEPQTIEMWVRLNSGAMTINQTGTVYTNGSAGATLDIGEWTLYHLVTAAPVLGSIVISGDISIAHFGLYEDAKSATEISDIYGSFTGSQTIHVGTSSTLSITSAAEPVKIYANDWSITGAG